MLHTARDLKKFIKISGSENKRVHIIINAENWKIIIKMSAQTLLYKEGSME